MSINELPINVKKQYQLHVNKLKSVRSFLLDWYSNFTNIQSAYSVLSTNLTSPMFSQMNHEAFNSIMAVFLDIYLKFK